MQALLNRKRGNDVKQGFALVELMVVIVIVGILSSVALPNFLGQSDKAKVTEAQSRISAALKAAGSEYYSSLTYDGMTAATLGLTSTTDFTYVCTPKAAVSIKCVGTGREAAVNLSAAGTLTAATGEINYDLDTDSSSSGESNLIASPSAIKDTPCNDGIQKTQWWNHKCEWTDLHFSTGAGKIVTGSGSLELLADGNLKFNGSYIGNSSDDLDRLNANLGATRTQAIKEGAFKQIFAGGYGGYAALRDDGSLMVMGYSTDYNDAETRSTIDALLTTSSPVEDVQFSYGGGGARLKNGEILTWGNSGYQEELRQRLTK